jgi:uncharacterized protein
METQPQTDPRLLEALICPLSKTRLEYSRATNELFCRAAGIAYPIRDGVPILVPDEARDLSATE